jgi:hypothetical protein
MNEKRVPKGLQGKSIGVIGGENQGKTSFIKENLTGDWSIAWDPKSQYVGICDTYCPGLIPSSTKLDEFLTTLIKLQNANAIMEEVSIFFAGTGKASSLYLNWMQGRYHSLNTPVNVFQAINEIPPAVYARTDLFVLFPTGETADKVAEKYSNTRLEEAFLSNQAKAFDPLIFWKTKAL